MHTLLQEVLFDGPISVQYTFLYPLKPTESHKFPAIFREYKYGALGNNKVAC